MNIAKSFKLATTVGRKWFVKNAPDVLIGVSIGMSTAAVVLTVPATTKAEKLIEKKQEEARMLAEAKNEEFREFGKLDKVKACWACYVPTLLTLGTGITAAIFANRINATRLAALATAYSLSEKKFKEYQDKVTELIGEDKEKKIHDAIAQDFVDKNPPTSLVPMTYFAQNGPGGDYLCADSVSGRYFRSTQEQVKRAFNEINRRLLLENQLNLNDLYDELGIPECEMGYLLGWTCHDYSQLVSPTFSTVMATGSGEPCLVVDYKVYPLHDFRDY